MKGLRVHGTSAVGSDKPRHVLPTKLERELAIGFFDKLTSACRRLKTIDKRAHGAVTYAEFRSALEGIGFKMTDAEFKKMCRHYDSNNTGHISYERFTRRIGQTITESPMGVVIPKPHGVSLVPGPEEPAGTSIEDMRKKLATPKATKLLEHRFATDVSSGMNRLAAAFSKYDKDHTGYIPHAEFVSALRAIGMHVTDRELLLMLRKYDPSNSGKVSLKEFSRTFKRMVHEQVKGMKVSERSSNKATATVVEGEVADRLFSKFRRVRDAFRMFDKSCSGVVSRSDFRVTLETMGFRLTDDEFDELMSEYDPDGKGYVSYTDFNNKIGGIIQPKESNAAAFATRDKGILHKTDMRPHSSRNPFIARLEKRFAAKALESLDDLETLFNKFDIDRSGEISPAEFLVALRSFGLRLSEEEGSHLVEKYDLDKNGSISLEEFKNAMRSIAAAPAEAAPTPTKMVQGSQAYETPEQLEKMIGEKLFSKFTKVRQAFRVFDASHTGSITYDEFRQALRMMGFELTDPMFKDLCAEYDTDGSGEISYLEFSNKVGNMIEANEGAGIIIRRPIGTVGRSKKRATPGIASEIESKFAQHAVSKMQSVEQAFKKFDTDNSGFLSYAEFVQALKAFGVRIPSAEMATKLMNLYDTDGDGRISMKEFTTRFTEMLKTQTAEPPFSARDETPRTPTPAPVSTKPKRSTMHKLKTYKMPDLSHVRSVIKDVWRRPKSEVVAERAARTLGHSASLPLLTKRAIMTPSAGGSVASVLSQAGEAEASVADALKAHWKDVFRAFKARDPDGTSTMMEHEFQYVLRSNGVVPKPHEWQALLAKYRRGAGRVAYVEFMRNVYNHRNPANYPMFSPMRWSLKTPGRPDTGAKSTARSAIPRWNARAASVTGDIDTDKMVHHHVRMEWREMRKEFMARDKGHNNTVTAEDFSEVLRHAGIELRGPDLHNAIRKFSKPDGRVAYNDFIRSQLGRSG